ncbi:MAG TPA: hypothetical protein DEG47_14115 [Cyanobacteria bacterium UBA11148]|nr:hypothetical protein [Cyanobacteria bacterium UBA11148]
MTDSYSKWNIIIMMIVCVRVKCGANELLILAIEALKGKFQALRLKVRFPRSTFRVQKSMFHPPSSEFAVPRSKFGF